MANKISTVRTYPLNGAVNFTITFEYLARKFVQVTLIGKDRRELVLNQDYRFTTKTQITTSRTWTAADGYQMIEIRRFTSATDRLVDFADGSILRAYDLNISQIQTLHVAEEARDLTADTIGVNNDGHLDARGRKIVNLAFATSDYDAVPLKQIKERESSAWNAVTKVDEHANRSNKEANRSRDEANRSKGEADRATQRANDAGVQANNSKAQADRATNEADRAKMEADRTSAIANDSKVQADRATNEANRSRDEANRAAGEVSKAAAHVTSAKGHADRSATEANRSRDEANRSKSAADGAKKSENAVNSNIESYGALPVGSVVATAINKAPAGFLKLDGTKFNTATYAALFAYLGTDTLPDWRNRYLKGALIDNEVGVFKGWGIPAHNGTARANGGHNHTGNTAGSGGHSHTGVTAHNGDHAHSGTTKGAGNHTHKVRYNNGFDGGGYTNRLVRGGDRGGYNGEDSIYEAIRPSGDHTHSFDTNTTGNHNHQFTTNEVGNHAHAFTTTTVNDHTHVVEIPAAGTGAADVDHVKVHWWIKAYGTTNAEDMAKVDGALQDIKKAVDASTEAKTVANSMGGRLSVVENSRKMVKLFEAKDITYGVDRDETMWYSEHDKLVNALVAAGQLPSGTTRATIALTVAFDNTHIGLYAVRATINLELYTSGTNDPNWYLVQASLSGHAANCERIMLGTRLKRSTEGGKAVLGFHIVGSSMSTKEAVGSYTAYASVIHY